LHYCSVFSAIAHRWYSQSAPADQAEDNFDSLTLLAEVLAARDLPGSIDLITFLLETLAIVAHSDAPIGSDVVYVEQLLMTAVEASANKITVSNLTPSSVMPA
jgi:U3 small nucleolar RNA-associated protein 10